MNYNPLRSVYLGIVLSALLGLSACGGATGKSSGAPSLAFSASKTTITAGQSVTLTWQATNATSVTITASTGSGSRTITTSSQGSGSVTDSPTQTTTYTAVATGAGGSTQPQTANVQVSQLVSLVFSANTSTITAGQSVTLTWNATSATSVTITATAGSSSRTIPTGSQLSGSVNDSPTQTTTYSAVATGAGGSTPPQIATVQVVQPLPPQITSFTASPVELNAGQTTTIAWATTNATSVTITPSLIQEGGGPLPASGSVITPVTSTTTFTITASGPGGTAGPQNVVVTVPFALSLTATPSTIKPGDQVTLSWQVNNGVATALSIDNSVCTACALPKGSSTVSPATTTTYTATATAADGTAITQSTTVTVGSPSTGVIKHIFFLLQENRSFDMYLGKLGSYQPDRLKQFGILNPPTVNGFDPNVTLTNAHTNAKVKPFHEATVCT